MTPRSADAAGSGRGRHAGGLLAVHAHPDDETLATGGLLAAWASAGRPVTVVTCTRGELGEVIGPDPERLEGDGPALAAHRERELEAALAALGVTDHAYLDALPAPLLDRPLAPNPSDPSVAGGGTGSRRFSDSGMAWAGVGRAGRLEDLPDGAFVAVPLDDAARPLALWLRERRPAVVVTYEPGGGYGHPDHVRAHEVTMRALELAGDPSTDLGGAPPTVPDAVLWAAVADDDLRSAYRELPSLSAAAAVLRRGRLGVPDAAGPLPSVAVRASAIDVVVDVTGLLGRIAAALTAHATQVQAIVVDPDGVASAGAERAGERAVVVGCYALSNDVAVPLLSHESYRLAPGSDGLARIDWPAGVRPVA